MKKILMGSLVAVALTACGGEPSEGAIKSALNEMASRNLKMVESTMGSALADQMKVEYTSVRKLECKAEGEDTYLCIVEAGMKMAGVEQKSIAPLRFAKGKDGWSVKL